MPYVEAQVRREQMTAAARMVLAREGVARTTLRAVAAQAGVPLGTMQYVFPSKEQLLQAVIEDVADQIADVLRQAADVDRGLAHAIRRGLEVFWSTLVEEHGELQLMQYELTTYALRTPGKEALAKRQYERYGDVVAAWCQEAADRAGETCTVPFTRLSRVLVAGVDGLVLQHICDPDRERSRADLETLAAMLIGLAGVEG